MNQLNTTKRAQIIAALIEGNSINATCRMLGVGKHTVLRFLEDAGSISEPNAFSTASAISEYVRND